MLLTAIAIAITTASSVEIYGLITSSQWDYLVLAAIRLFVPLFLVHRIWRGRAWARFVLAAFTAWTIYINSHLIQLLPKMYDRSDSHSLLLVGSILLAYIPTGIAALFSSWISGLIAFRQDEVDLA
ncbi:hypothetical protein [Novipirellula caenicola]|uniref:Uncharacterized protein n=1 Tax=Novipirellula caenicola TaxID=1536901 RepID=A0ABP9VJK7_9BACT